MGKVIQWEMSKKFKFDHANKWYMHNLAPVLENDGSPNLDQKTRYYNKQQKKKKKKKERKPAKLSTLLSQLTTE